MTDTNNDGRVSLEEYEQLVLRSLLHSGFKVEHNQIKFWFYLECYNYEYRLLIFRNIFLIIIIKYHYKYFNDILIVFKCSNSIGHLRQYNPADKIMINHFNLINISLVFLSVSFKE